MEIRIRSAAMSRAVVLADVPFRADVIDKIIPTLQGWGLQNEDGEMFAEDDIVGQFVIDEKREETYFEVVAGT